MSVKVGIPRALLYYHYYPQWYTFFDQLQVTVVVSPPTNKHILEQGIAYCLDEACLPVKVAFGHLAQLADQVDFIFLPRLVSVFPREYICPKFLGLPEMVRHSGLPLPPLLVPAINTYRRQSDLMAAFQQLGNTLGRPDGQVRKAARLAQQVQQEYEKLLLAGWLPEQASRLLLGRQAQEQQVRLATELSPSSPPEAPEQGKGRIAIIGHPYLVYDSYLNMNLLQKLTRRQWPVAVVEQVSSTEIQKQTARLPKKIFWTLGRLLIGAGYHFLSAPHVAGLIHLSSFACGPDALIGELIASQARNCPGKPFMNIVIDEHSGEAGLLTRLEAFLDMVTIAGGRAGASA
ncbi:acyl-CoA dehydratase activase-related protein [Desulfurispora thermophila]|uniref:acyl-CoA dehydratase activase-related protein n=1 Tax=Desulfurispora thermophila TaxID=265470 RepID=UPI000683DEB3|nr:acyl-CoA dehydratase activase-related protein [Desulfurispora thermophila]